MRKEAAAIAMRQREPYKGMLQETFDKGLYILMVRWDILEAVSNLKTLVSLDPNFQRELNGLEIVLELLDKRLDTLGFLKEDVIFH